MLKINTYTIDQLKNYYITKKWLREAMKNKGKKQRRLNGRLPQTNHENKEK